MLRRRPDALQPAVDALSSTVEKVLDNQALRDENLALQIRVAALEGEIELARQKIRFLEADLQRITSLQPSSVPLYFTEEEEDAMHLARTGQIDKTELKEILEAAGLDPNLEFEADAYPHLSKLTS